MKKLGIIIVLVAAVLNPVFVRAIGGPPPAPKGPTTFVEEPIPDGKAIIYIYNTVPQPFAMKGWGSVMVFSKNGPLTVLPMSSYFTFITDPGTVDLWVVAGQVGGQYAPGMIARKLSMEAIAGQASYLAITWGFDVKVLPSEEAKKDTGILYCKKVG